MLFSFVVTILATCLVCVGLGWPIAARLALSAAEKFVATVALSLLGTFAIGWTIYIFHAPNAALWALPILAGAGLRWRPAEFIEMCRDGSVRQMVVAQTLVTFWCVSWLATVASYSGGGWAADWYEHWERARFFLDHAPLDTKFLGQYALTARPPLANIVTAALVWLTRGEFAHYQLVLTLLGSLVLLPAALFVWRWGGGQGIAVLAVLLMVNPAFTQNATFAWTKLPAAFFVLSGLYFFLRTLDTPSLPTTAPLFAACLAAGLLTHYSAGPYAVVLAIAWFCFGWPRRREQGWRRDTMVAGAIGAVMLTIWFSWAAVKFGGAGTFLTNSSVTSAHAHQGSQIAKIALNLWDTLVPHFLRSLDTSLIAQSSSWGAARDWFFQSYQVNLPLAFGSVAWLAIACELWRASLVASHCSRVFWLSLITGAVLLGVAVHGQRDQWGLAHICLQPLIPLGLAFLAARWGYLSRGWKRALLIGATVDVVCGIALHFGVQSFALDHWLGAGRSPEAILMSYNESAVMNVQAKIQHRLVFFSDALGSPFVPAVSLAATALVLALIRARARSRATQPEPRTRATRPLGILAIAVSAIALAHLWDGWCAFPISSWNESRLAPSFALRYGVPLYPPPDGGPLSTWTYGPVCPVINLPATLADSVTGAIEIAGAINALTLILPIAIVCIGTRELRGLGWPALIYTIALLVALLPEVNLQFQVADHAAIALGLLSCWFLTREPIPSSRSLAAAALCCALSISSKQIAVLVPAGQLLFLWQQRERRGVAHYIGWLAGFGLTAFVVNVAAFGLDDLWFCLVQVPGAWPWGDVRLKLTQHGPWLAAYLLLPIMVLLLLRPLRLWPTRDSAIDRLLRCGIFVSFTTLPLGLAALFKIGGASNVVHAWYFLLTPMTLAIVVAVWHRPSALRWAVAAAAIVTIARWPALTAPSRGPITPHIDEAVRIAHEHPHTVWFPFNPLVTFYSDKTLYHDEDGIMGRTLSKLTQSSASLHRYVPADLQAIVVPATLTTSVALQLFPDYRERTVDGYWAFYRRTTERSP